MNHIVHKIIPLLFILLTGTLFAQEDYQDRIEKLKAAREQVVTAEKEALKAEVLEIERRREAGEISAEQAQVLKTEAARKRALNIEDRQQMIDREIALLERNAGVVATQEKTPPKEVERIELSLGVGEASWIRWEDPDRPVPYDRRTYSDMVLAFGLNNAIADGQGLEDSPYKVAGSRFFEIGWAWRTRVFKESNFMRLHYGVSFQFNGLKPEGNQVFVSENGQTTLQPFDVELRKAKFRMDNLVVPVHLEFGPSRFREYEDRIRYSLRNQFRIGFGGYAGLNLGARQKLKYTRDGERVKDKLKRDYNTSDFVYGLSAYIGVEGVLLYAKYDLNPIFENAAVEQHNVSLGLRFDL
ncbi:hypothetical protein OZ410_01025 [Robiginitalea sp. M366]|uniref:hypothetical protein n=1 Tax=Robiginitalea aestuariiviva TaxID=3036903 RepID=UPI00240D10A2|nr:hypothetical protein [Robiginitalea aestuariiviva]MDG1570881.1 hypothetical protein [Robiginitalea aestuariiviva]